jgi:hypothetical protein
VVFVGDLVDDILGNELESRRPGAKHFAEADDEGVPFAVATKEFIEFIEFVEFIEFGHGSLLLSLAWVTVRSANHQVIRGIASARNHGIT